MMMRTLLLLLLLSSLVFFSCKKEDTRPECEREKYATLLISNNSNNRYNLYINNAFALILQPHEISIPIHLSSGNNKILKAVQAEGYLLFPTEVTTTMNVVACSNYDWQIP